MLLLHRPLQRCFLCILILLYVFHSACQSKNEADPYAAEVLNTLELSLKPITHSTRSLMATMEESMNDSATVHKAKIWFPKARVVVEQSNEFYNFLEIMKNELKNEPGKIKVNVNQINRATELIMKFNSKFRI